MRILNTDAWAILTVEEQTSLSLMLGQGKSTWESGEIMKKAHYKFLEIYARAQKFLRMFTEHYELYPDFFPLDLRISPEFKTFLKWVLLKRKVISRAIDEIDQNKFRNKTFREGAFIAELNRLRISQKTSERNFHALIMDFDKWNNYRVLPFEIQEPSAFKRRNMRRHKRHIKELIQFHPLAAERLIELYEYKPKRIQAKLAFVGLILSLDEEEYKVLQIADKEKTINHLSSLGLYVFPTREIADNFINSVLDFYHKEDKTCKDGLIFWPQYREVIKRAINYDGVNRITEFRKFSELSDNDLLAEVNKRLQSSPK